MIIGSTLFKLDGTEYYSPSFPHGGLGATFLCDVTHLEGSPTVTITVEHRTEEETSFTSLAVFTSITTVGLKTLDAGSIKEVVRFKYEFDAGDAATDAIHFAMMAPSWRPY